MRASAHNRRLSAEDVEDIREEWSRKHELLRVAAELEARAEELQREVEELRMLAKDISRSNLSLHYGVSVNTISNIINTTNR